MTTIDLCPETGLPITPRLAIRPDWIDYNGHLNVAFYVKLFDEGIDLLFESQGLAESYVRERQLGFFAAELHVRYLRELHLTDPVQVRLQVLDFDAKRIHYWMELVHADGRWLSATMESISLHVDMTTRKVAPFPDDVMTKLGIWKQQTAGRGTPEGVGRTIGIPRKAAAVSG
ncbi:thioesterase family protein [Phreatobacter stygius]|uniref:Thioesterase n=1 Tax=Phreatobacter stygius TaxID=1940610 RepID=A0A4D7B491_9HYPH|nr:thioesterase family protein [Phreatobacter stygius]QCI65833.1 thioesterase [Phreatobacter stygius]